MSITGCVVRKSKEVIIQKIRNRIISLVLSFACFLMLALPVSAASDPLPYFDLTQANYQNNMNFNLSSQTGTSKVFTFPNDLTYTVFGVDLIVFSENNIKSISITSPSVSLTKESLGNNLYRFYGYIEGEPRVSKNISLTFATTSSVTEIQICSFKVYTSPPEGYQVESVISLRLPNGEYLEGFSSENNTLSFDGLTFDYRLFDFDIEVIDASKFDRCTVEFYAYCAGINSIYASYGNQAVPYNISFLNASVEGRYLVSLDVDLSNIKRDNSKPLTIMVEAVANAVTPEDLTVVTIFDAIGYVYSRSNFFTDVISSIGSLGKKLISNMDMWGEEISTWLDSVATRITNSIKLWGQNIVDAIIGDSEDIDTSAGDDLVNQGQQIEDFEQQHQEVINGSTGTITDSLDITGFVPALSLISSFVGNTFDILGPYQQVLIMPISIGLFMFICSRVPGNMVAHVSRVSSKSIDPKSKEL